MLWRILLVSFRSLSRRPVRTLLVLQGVIWGTALGVLPSSILRGSVDRAENDANALGTNRILIYQDLVDVRSTFDWRLPERLLGQNFQALQHATALAVLGSTPEGYPIIATPDGQESLAARGLTLAAGRPFSPEDIVSANAVGILHGSLAEILFGDSDPLGTTVVLDETRSVRIVGVTEKRAEGSEFLDDLGYRRDHPMREVVEGLSQTLGYFEHDSSPALSVDTAIMVPHSLAPDTIPQFLELRAEPKSVLKLRSRLRQELAEEGYEPVVLTNAALPLLYGETVDLALELNQVVFMLSIVVGTSIVGALMILSVLERQREIAIRRVEGARRWHIGLQFTVETGLMCTLGGILGVPLGIALAMIRCAIESLDTVAWGVPVRESITVVLIVLVVGLIGGLLPAIRAMRVDPVEMLRYE